MKEVSTLIKVSRTLFVVALLPLGAASQVAQFEGKRIIDIQYSPAQTLDAADLAKAQPLKKGEPFHQEDVAQAIDGLFATGRFEDIVVEAEAAGDGVIVRFITKNAWFLGGVSLDGKILTPPNRGQLVSTSQLNLGAPYHDEDLTKALDGMKHLLDANGFYESKITPSV
jgi:outer membrane protein assembly factor BamA